MRIALKDLMKKSRRGYRLPSQFTLGTCLGLLSFVCVGFAACYYFFVDRDWLRPEIQNVTIHQVGTVSNRMYIVYVKIDGDIEQYVDVAPLGVPESAVFVPYFETKKSIVFVSERSPPLRRSTRKLSPVIIDRYRFIYSRYVDTIHVRKLKNRESLTFKLPSSFVSLTQDELLLDSVD